MVSPAAPSSLLVVGGARSGKSRFAQASLPACGRVTVLATAQAGDADMAARIAHHRAGRPASWRTVEEPLQLARRLAEAVEHADAVLVDCLTLWVTNRLLDGDTEAAILAEAEAVAALLGRRACAVTLVSNEVGEGVHPETPLGRRFRDLLGIVNQCVAAAADRVVLMVAGIPLTVKDRGAADARPAP